MSLRLPGDECPFCGSDSPASIPLRDGAAVRCFDCGAMGPIAPKGSNNDHHERAVKAWNRRSIDPVPLSDEEEAKLANKARELVSAVEDVTRLIAMPTLAKKAAETKLILMGETVQ